MLGAGERGCGSTFIPSQFWRASSSVNGVGSTEYPKVSKTAGWRSKIWTALGNGINHRLVFACQIGVDVTFQPEHRKRLFFANSGAARKFHFRFELGS